MQILVFVITAMFLAGCASSGKRKAKVAEAPVPKRQFAEAVVSPCEPKIERSAASTLATNPSKVETYFEVGTDKNPYLKMRFFQIDKATRSTEDGFAVAFLGKPKVGVSYDLKEKGVKDSPHGYRFNKEVLHGKVTYSKVPNAAGEPVAMEFDLRNDAKQTLAGKVSDCLRDS